MEIWHYTLLSDTPLNAASEATAHQGCLIRHQGGYGNIHPWPALGDAPLSVQLEALRAGSPTLLTQQALHCCELDAAARQAGQSLFEGVSIPRSHATLPALPKAGDLPALAAAGFTHLKCKIRLGQLDALNALGPALRAQNLLLRLDFNAVPTAETFLHFCQSLDDSLRQQIDFMEDPCPYLEETWKVLAEKTGFRLAADFVDKKPGLAAAVLVIKPAVEAHPVFPAEMVTTSYMDHPVGQMYAAYLAAKHTPEAVCGLLTHHLYAPHLFSEAVHCHGPVLKPTQGTGLGFDSLLKSLPWSRL